VIEIAHVNLLFAALILEYVDVPMTMRSLQTLCTPGERPLASWRECIGPLAPTSNKLAALSNHCRMAALHRQCK
jgi:hypothetical protein